MKPRRKNRTWTEPNYRGIQREASNGLIEAAMQKIRDGLTDEEINSIVTQAIIDSVHDCGEVRQDHFRRLNLPAGEPTTPRFRRCLARAKEMCPSLDARAFNPVA